MKLLHVVGTRPNIPKLAPVFKALSAEHVDQAVVHTGQHFDPALSDVLFEELQLPPADIKLNTHTGTPVQQTAQVMLGLEQVLELHAPKIVVVYGDVNSTAAAALVSSKLGIVTAHVEAGLRSRDRTMPEELNRLVTDALCDIAFTTSPDATENLIREGRDSTNIHFVGNPMIDSLRSVESGLPASPFSARFGAKGYALVTLHRPGNVDAHHTRERIIDELLLCADMFPLVFPVHPRRRQEFESSLLGAHPGVILTDPLSYLEFLSAMRDAQTIVTDSGGVQEEATAMNVRCLTLRPNTERPVTITEGTNTLVSPASLVREFRSSLTAFSYVHRPMPTLWDGKSGPRIANILTSYLTNMG